jgi:adenylate cyclase
MKTKALTPKTRRSIARIIPFGFIWTFFFGSQIVNDLSTQSATEQVSTGDIPLTPEVALFALFASFISGLLVGSIEVLVFSKRFRNYNFISTIFVKLGIYLLLFLLIIITFYPIASSIESQNPIFSEKTLNSLLFFMGTLPFWNTLIQLGFGLLLCVVYSSVSENLGYNCLRNILAGVYHKPIVEERIFMFLDMKDSTQIAEVLGHQKYFELLSDYYDTMSDAIINHKGEVYQYIGDEVVVTWKAKDGLDNANCLDTFFAIGQELQRRSEYFMENYGIVPSYKAGLHLGEVSTGEIGALKREIVFTGDVLNTAARLQGRCNTYQKDCLISGELLSMLPTASAFKIEHQGDEVLKGKEGSTAIYSVEAY